MKNICIDGVSNILYIQCRLKEYAKYIFHLKI